MPLNKQALTLPTHNAGKARADHGEHHQEHHNHRITLAQGIALIFGTNRRGYFEYPLCLP